MKNFRCDHTPTLGSYSWGAVLVAEVVAMVPEVGEKRGSGSYPRSRGKVQIYILNNKCRKQAGFGGYADARACLSTDGRVHVQTICTCPRLGKYFTLKLARSVPVRNVCRMQSVLKRSWLGCFQKDVKE